MLLRCLVPLVLAAFMVPAAAHGQGCGKLVVNPTTGKLDCVGSPLLAPPFGALPNSISISGAFYAPDLNVPTVIKLPQGRPILTLSGGQSNETWTTGGTGTPSVSADTVNFKLGTQGWKFTMGGSGTGQFTRTVSPTIAPPPISAIGMWVYLTEVTNLTGVYVNIFSGANEFGVGSQALLSSTSSPPMAIGWNHIRWAAAVGTVSGLQAITSIRLLISATGATNITLGHLYAEMPAKGNLILVADGAYLNFLNGSGPGTSAGGRAFLGGYPDLKALQVPVVWGVDGATVGTGTGANTAASWAQLATAMADGRSEMNYHTGDGNNTATMTSTQIIHDTMTAVTLIEQHGYPFPAIRSGWFGNMASNAAASQPYSLGYATAVGHTNETTQVPNAWPPTNPWDIGRAALETSQGTTLLDSMFSAIQNSHATVVIYVHQVDPASTSADSHVTPAIWGYFLDKIATGLSGGWLNVTTFNQLLAENGVSRRRGLGYWATEYYDQTGVLQTKVLP